MKWRCGSLKQGLKQLKVSETRSIRTHTAAHLRRHNLHAKGSGTTVGLVLFLPQMSGLMPWEVPSLLSCNVIHQPDAPPSCRFSQHLQGLLLLNGCWRAPSSLGHRTLNTAGHSQCSLRILSTHEHGTFGHLEGVITAEPDSEVFMYLADIRLRPWWHTRKPFLWAS